MAEYVIFSGKKDNLQSILNFLILAPSLPLSLFTCFKINAND